MIYAPYPQPHFLILNNIPEFPQIENFFVLQTKQPEPLRETACPKPPCQLGIELGLDPDCLHPSSTTSEDWFCLCRNNIHCLFPGNLLLD